MSKLKDHGVPWRHLKLTDAERRFLVDVAMACNRLRNRLIDEVNEALYRYDYYKEEHPRPNGVTMTKRFFELIKEWDVGDIPQAALRMTAWTIGEEYARAFRHTGPFPQAKYYTDDLEFVLPAKAFKLRTTSITFGKHVYWFKQPFLKKDKADYVRVVKSKGDVFRVWLHSSTKKTKP